MHYRRVVINPICENSKGAAIIDFEMSATSWPSSPLAGWYAAWGLRVSKRRDRPYRSGRSPDWVKVKNPNAPAATRIVEW